VTQTNPYKPHGTKRLCAKMQCWDTARPQRRDRNGGHCQGRGPQAKRVAPRDHCTMTHAALRAQRFKPKKRF
jgi:hypothetical protein